MTRVIRVVDFETAGDKPPAEVVEVGFCDVYWGEEEEVGGWRIGTPVSFLCGAERLSAEARAVHHIDPAELAGRALFDARGFVDLARSELVTELAAHNATFEGQWLAPALDGLPLVCTYKAALRVWPDAPAHKNQVLRYWLEEQGHGAIDPVRAHPAHRAGPDAYATASMLRHLLECATVDELITWTAEPALMPRCPLGKWRGSKWSEVEAGFLDWMLRQPTMDPDLKWNADRELRRRRGVRDALLPTGGPR